MISPKVKLFICLSKARRWNAFQNGKDSLRQGLVRNKILNGPQIQTVYKAVKNTGLCLIQLSPVGYLEEPSSGKQQTRGSPVLRGLDEWYVTSANCMCTQELSLLNLSFFEGYYVSGL